MSADADAASAASGFLFILNYLFPHIAFSLSGADAAKSTLQARPADIIIHHFTGNRKGEKAEC
jgi:hypothetical protein